MSARIEAFVDWFIRQDHIHPDIQDLYLSDPDRADRCDAAAEHGADGSTHREVIQDWRDAFSAYLRDRHRNRRSEFPYRFESAVTAHFDACEDWHITNGSIDEEIG
jgi:hypothetical protein